MAAALETPAGQEAAGMRWFCSQIGVTCLIGQQDEEVLPGRVQVQVI